MKKPIFDKYLLIWMQCADFLKSKLPGWEEICSDATKVPEKVRMMIDEIRTPGSTPVSGTPQPSPMVKRNTLVSSSWLGVSSVGVEQLQEALLDLSIWDIYSASQLEYTGLGYGTKVMRLKLCYGENAQQRRESTGPNRAQLSAGCPWLLLQSSASGLLWFQPLHFLHSCL